MGNQDSVPAKNYIIGGTSIASPIFASYLACINYNKFINTQLYLLDKLNFNDIVIGSNGNYKAKNGYDNCSGLGSIIGNTTRPVVIKMKPAPIELETNPLYTKTENYLYVKSPVFPNPIIQYEYQILETITGTNGAIAKVANLEYFQLVKDETQ